MACKDERQYHFMLAENQRVGSVSVCGCGTVHLSVGAVSVRLSPEVFSETVTMMRMALHTLLQEGAALGGTPEVVH